MHKVSVSIGSNIQREYYIASALKALEKRFKTLNISNYYDCEPVGFQGDNFLNLVVTFQCSLSVGDLAVFLRSIEDANDRNRAGKKFGSRTLDIDILTFGDLVGVIDGVELPRGEITENAFVLGPLVDVMANDIHPITQLSYQQMWDNYDKTKQSIITIDFKYP